jgi:hypothetical protein
VLGPVKGRYAPLRRVPVASGHSVRLARISDTLAGAGLVLAAPTGFRTLRIHPVLAAARKPVGTTMPCTIIPQQCERCGLELLANVRSVVGTAARRCYNRGEQLPWCSACGPPIS